LRDFDALAASLERLHAGSALWREAFEALAGTSRRALDRKSSNSD